MVFLNFIFYYLYMASLLEEMNSQAVASKENPKVRLELIKLAEEKIKNINTALDKYEKKYKQRFPIQEYDKSETIWNGGGFINRYDKKLNTKITKNKVEVDIITDHYSSGEPVTNTYKFYIKNNKLYSCTRYGSDYNGKEFGKPFSYFMERYDVNSQRSIRDKAPTYKEMETLCFSLTKPQKVFMSGENGDHVENVLEGRGQYTPNIIELSAEDQAKHTDFLTKSKNSGIIYGNADVWKRVNDELDKYQNELVRVSKENLRKIEAQKQYVLEQKAKVSKINL